MVENVNHKQTFSMLIDNSIGEKYDSESDAGLSTM